MSPWSVGNYNQYAIFSLLSGILENMINIKKKNNQLVAAIKTSDQFWDTYGHLPLGRLSTALEGHETGHEAPVIKRGLQQ